jgi:EAL domain-containing protein (putative c-di-GMP-specific phosphodiesterase class I)
VTAESLGWQLRSALPPMRLHSISIYNNEADVLWLSEGALGPDEHNVVIEAIEHLQNEKGTLYHELGMEDGRIAIFLGLRGPRMELVGTVMILADMKSLSEGTMERILTVPVKTLMQKMAVFLRKQYPHAGAGDSSIVAAVPPPADVKPIADAKPVAEVKLAPAPAVPPAAAKNSPAQSEPLAPKQVDAILTLELVDEPPPAPPASPPKAADKPKAVSPVAAPAPTPFAAKPVVKAVPKKVQPLQAAAAAKSALASKASPSAKAPVGADGRAQNDASPEPAPSRDIEILPFEDDISITQARRALPPTVAQATVADIEVLPFDGGIQIPTAHPAPAAAAPAAEIEVLDFDAELTMPPARVSVAHAAPIAEPPVAKAAPAAEPPVVRAAPAARAETVAPKAAPLVEPAAAAQATPAQFETFSSKSSTAEPPVAKAAPASFEPFAPKAAPAAEPTAPKGVSAPAEHSKGTAAAEAAKAASAASGVGKSIGASADSKFGTASPASSISTKGTGVAPASANATASASSSASARAAKSAPAATVSVPVLNTGSTTSSKRVPASRDDDVLLIQDTGPVKRLELPVEAIEEPVLPPPPPLTVEETATDLSLYVQELIKLRSSGRTRRYEVLARSQRDANRNEVPTAFIAETAKGREGAALDALVVERLLQWLGQHGETIWDSEPASFSVNLSIGALEDEHFVEKIAGWLEQYKVEAEYVGFEVSEFACVQSRPAVLRFVEACEKLGCFLVIDNFSFDSNMFELLGSKTLRHVKIDPKLTSAAMKEKLPQALVVAILQACKVLGVHCVAKRIESQASLQWLTAVGCDFAQTFQLEKPRAIDTLVSGKAIKALRE